ncbi:MAG TPA: hypothetical protein VEL80_05500 [Burkholderiales bacterium]|nr:hypothetical protein [Burkholderiales bacterium]
MNTRGIYAAAIAAAMTGCASTSENPGGPATAHEVRIYSPAQLLPAQYETVRRLWVESWRAKFWVPSYSTEEDGLSALRNKAAQLGANGLINVACYKDRGLFSLPGSTGSDFNCYGKAIRVRDTGG